MKCVSVVRYIAALLLVWTCLAGPAHAEPEASPFAEKLARTRVLLEQQKEPSVSVRSPNPAPEGEVSWLRMLEGLALCLGLFLVAVGLIRRRANSTKVATGRRMRSIERMQVGPRGSVVLLQVDGVDYLVGVGADQVSVTPLHRQTEARAVNSQARLDTQEFERVIELSRRAAGGEE